MRRAAERAPERAGWLLVPWCADASIGRATYYKLPPKLQPHSVKVGKRRIIRESPADWLARMAAAQEAA
jgi:hypothetical protein